MRIFRFDKIDSTNKYLKEKKDRENNDLIIAKIQDSGIGRRGNKWIASEGAALFSFGINSEEKFDLLTTVKIPLVIGIAVLRAIKNHPLIIFRKDLNIQFKWTNDIYLNGKKLSGILVEKIDNYFILGIGININNVINEELKSKAISLNEVLKEELDVEEFIFRTVIELKKYFKKFSLGNWEEILTEINEENFLLNKEIEVHYSGEILEGTALTILDNGCLEFVTKDNKKIELAVGEVHLKV